MGVGIPLGTNDRSTNTLQSVRGRSYLDISIGKISLGKASK